jgi:hypothetical protein
MTSRFALESTPDPLSADLWPVPEATLPDAQYRPTSVAQPAGVPAISSLVCFELGLPDLCVATGCKVATTLVSMPKTSVDKQGEPLTWPAEVGVTEQVWVPSPTVQALSPQQGQSAQLSGLVPSGPNAPH